MDTAPIQLRIKRIAQKICAVLDGQFTPFGSDHHGFRMNPPLALREVAAFEARQNITLPEGYRAFITQVCDGPIGPAYGMFTLEMAAAKDDPLPLDYLQTPFPHVSYYKPLDDPSVREMWEKADRGEVSDAEIDRYILYRTAGTLNLCHEGCGRFHRLVVTGPTRGQMWLDDEENDQGYLPLGVDFLEWYERWLDDTLDDGEGTWWLTE